MGNKEIEVIINIKDNESVEKLIARVLAEIIADRINKYTVEDSNEIYSKILENFRQ